MSTIGELTKLSGFIDERKTYAAAHTSSVTEGIAEASSQAVGSVLQHHPCSQKALACTAHRPIVGS